MYSDFEMRIAHQDKSQRFLREAEQYRLARQVPKGARKSHGGALRGRLFRRGRHVASQGGEVAAT